MPSSSTRLVQRKSLNLSLDWLTVEVVGLSADGALEDDTLERVSFCLCWYSSTRYQNRSQLQPTFQRVYISSQLAHARTSSLSLLTCLAVRQRLPRSVQIAPSHPWTRPACFTRVVQRGLIESCRRFFCFFFWGPSSFSRCARHTRSKRARCVKETSE